MSKMLSGGDVGVREAESEREGKMPLADVTNCMKLRDTRPSANKNRTFLTLAIPRNSAQLSTRSSAATDQFSVTSGKTNARRQKHRIPKLREKTSSPHGSNSPACTPFLVSLI
jgi:hypothetical protein